MKVVELRRNQSVQIVAKTSAFSVGLNGMLVIGVMRLKEQEMNDVLFRQLAKDNKWPACPSCGRCVELGGGCAVMTCRCRTKFCYHCGTRLSSGYHPCRKTEAIRRC